MQSGMKAKLIFSLLAITCLSAQAAAEDKAPAPAAAAAKPAPSVPVAAIDWKSMDAAQKKKYMKEKVLPEMKVVFASYDAKKYAKVNCGTCHGEGAVKGTFKMPNPGLPKLPAAPAGFKEVFEKKPKIAQFMAKEVKPKMAALLGFSEFTPANPTGFSCYACHEKNSP